MKIVFDFGGVVFRWHPASFLARVLPQRIETLEQGARAAAQFFQNYGGDWGLFDQGLIGADEVVPHYGLMGPVKAALESLVRYLAVELGPQSIRVHAVSPGPILTRAASGIGGFDEILDQAIQKSALGRLVTLDEIAQLTAFLCSPAATGMTGQTLYVDAGCHAVA